MGNYKLKTNHLHKFQVWILRKIFGVLIKGCNNHFRICETMALLREASANEFSECNLATQAAFLNEEWKESEKMIKEQFYGN